MAAYRLFTDDVSNGITGFNDEVYHILDTIICNNGFTVALIYNERGRQFIIANGLHYEKFNSIHWDYGDYFSKIIPAAERFSEKITRLQGGE